LATTFTRGVGRQIYLRTNMKNIIHQVPSIDLKFGNLQDETQKRYIPLLPIEGQKVSIFGYTILRIKVFINKFFNLWKAKRTQQ
jgi:hypothetical protein